MRNIDARNISGREGADGMGYTGGPMTEAMYYVLLALLEPSHGYRLMQAVGEVSGGRVKMGPGTLYGVLSRLEEDGLIRRLPDRVTRRKTYELTPDGREALFTEYHRLEEMIRDMKRMKEAIRHDGENI